MPKQNFPGPYVSTTTEDDPMMIRRPADHMEIASRPSTLRNTHKKSDKMGIDHTKDANSK